jgi:hypothetical protein
LLEQSLGLFVEANDRLGQIARLGAKPQTVVPSLPVFGGDSPRARTNFFATHLPL